VVSAGPNAKSVTMRRSNGSPDAFSPLRGQNSAAAIANDGSRKKIWLPRNATGCKMWSNHPRAAEARWLA
jgi:hypothetical protein